MSGFPGLLKSILDLPPVSIAETLGGGPGIVDLFYFFYEGVDDPELVQAYFALMTPEERARHDRYYFERDRRMFLATRALARTVLSLYADVPPAAWRFGEGERGKPFISVPKATPPLHFNLTNTLGLVVCAVSVAHPAVGVDAEFLERAGETVSIADHYFSVSEARALRSLAVEKQRHRFFSYWTLKESYIKARGMGLALPLEQFSFLLDDGPEIGITFDLRLRDDPRRWRFALLSAADQHLVAVGVDTQGAPLSLRGCRFIPLGPERAFPREGGTGR
jgi:4'-phosphopantetheinyl transferase